jgi:hypothetical protein
MMVNKSFDYCQYLVYSPEREENICTCRNWLWVACNYDCIRTGDRKDAAIEKRINEFDRREVARLGQLLAHLKRAIVNLSGEEAGELGEAIAHVEYDILRRKHEVPWLSEHDGNSPDFLRHL